ncbi:hypothetical protein [Streptomyces nitrosporeus]|uniref:hypothetical protein n=1 Tax=Streptomyces nitrosporeus TaxID=28894 RepID=UPI0039A3E434
MTFPQVPLDVRTDLRIGGVWTDATADVYTRDPITITRGSADEATSAEPSSCTLTLNNRHGKYSPRNPMSPYYGLIGRNTPVRVSVRGPESYLQLEGSTTSYARTPDTAALDITGDIDVRVEATVDWTSATSQALIGKWDSAGAQRSYLLRIVGGVLVLNWSADGATTLFGQVTLPALPRRAALRATLDVNNGSGGFTAAFYWARNLTGPWTLIDTATAAGPTSIYAGTAPLEVAPIAASGVTPVAGRVHRAEVRSGIGGTVVAAPDPRALAEGVTAWTDSAGRAWTLGPDAAVSDRQYRFHGEISAWPSRWDVSGQDVWVPIEAAGITRRMSQGQKALDSTLRRRVPSDPNLIAYWPMEDGEDATTAYSPLPGVAPLAMPGFDFGSDDSLGGSNPLPKAASGASFQASVPRSTRQGWQVETVYYLPAMPVLQTEILRVAVAGSAMAAAVVYASTAGIRIEAQASDGTVLGAFLWDTPAGVAAFWGKWNRLGVYTAPAGGSCYLYVRWRDIATNSYSVARTLIAAAQGAVTGVSGTYGSGADGLALGHLAVFDVPATGTDLHSPPGSTIFTGADDGFNGESTLNRLARLAAEESAQVTLSWADGDTGRPSEAMGPQRPDTLLTLLEECADSDGGILYERADAAALLYRDRATLYNQDVALALDYTAEGEVPPPLEPTEDDQRIRNDVTITRRGGSSGRAVLETGPLSVQPPPAGVGPYDESITVSLYSDVQPPLHAQWRMHLGTWDEARYPTITVWLHAAPHLIDQVLGMDIGDRVQIAHPPPWLPPGTIDQHMRGYTETLGLYDWSLTMNCVPGGPWTVGVVGDPVLGRADTDGSQLGGPVDEAATVLPVTVTAGPRWVTGAPNVQPNPNFEEGTGLWGCSRGDSIGTVSWERDIVHSGTGACRLTRVHPTDTGTMNLAERWVVYPAGPGQVWTGRVWVYSGGAATNAMRLALVWQTAGGDVFAYGTAVPTGPGYWQELTVTATAPVGTTGVRLSPEGRSAWAVGEWWIADDLRLARTDTLVGDDQGDQFPFAVTLGGEEVDVLGISGVAGDEFERVVASGWGTTPGGQAWIETGGTTSNRAVTSGAGTLTISAPVTTWRIQRLGLTLADCEIEAVVSVSQTAVGGALSPCILLRHVSDTDFYVVRPYFYPDGLVYLSLYTNAEGTIGGFPSSGYSYTPGQQITVRARIDGQRVRARIWPTASREPEGQWHLDATATTAVNPSGDVGILGFCESGSTNTNPILSVHSFRIVTPQHFTVTRAANGITKAHATGTPLSLTHPMRAAL